MSTPWLFDGEKTRSRSGSNSPDSDRKRSLRVDQFGRTMPRSRSRSRSWDRDRKGPRGPNARDRGRGADRGSRRPRKREGSGSSSSSHSSVHSGDAVRLVAREEPKYLNARVFVANLISKDVTKDELTKHFEKYGNVVDLLIHPKNYAFIQYLKEEHARLAVEGEHGGTLKGWRLDVKMANEGRRGGPNTGGNRGKGRGWGGGPPDMGRGAGMRDRSPFRDDPYDNPYGPGGPKRPPPFPGDYGMRDPFYPPDPYRRGFHDPWLPPPDDPFRRDPYADPYRDPFPPVRAPQLPIECEIFLVSSSLRAYGEAIEDRIKALQIITCVTVMPEGQTAPEMLEDLSQRDGLFAVFVNAQNESHRSLTLNILHGTPQEHRNMPMNDAISLINRSFEQYVEALREKANAKSGGAGTSRVFLPPSQEVTYLLNLLADNRALTVDELNQVIKYLEERKNKLVDAERRPLASEDKAGESAAPPKPAGPSTEEITSKILSIFNSAGGNLQGVPPANNGVPAPQSTQHPAPPPPPPPPPAASAASSSANLINFDNPNVQKALDNLIQSSPALLKNLQTSDKMAASSAAPETLTSPYSSTAASTTLTTASTDGANYGRPSGSAGGSDYGRPSGSAGGSDYGRPSGSDYGRPSGSAGGSDYGRPSGSAGGPDYGRPSGFAGGSDYGRPSGSGGGSDYGRPSGSAGGSDYGRPSGPGYGQSGDEKVGYGRSGGPSGQGRSSGPDGAEFGAMEGNINLNDVVGGIAAMARMMMPGMMSLGGPGMPLRPNMPGGPNLQGGPGGVFETGQTGPGNYRPGPASNQQQPQQPRY